MLCGSWINVIADILNILQLDINTVAAGGGSQLFFRAGMFVVGPESAGAHPGPVCYKKGSVIVRHYFSSTFYDLFQTGI